MGTDAGWNRKGGGGLMNPEKKAARGLLTIPQAAALMGLGRVQAWRRLTSINGRYPELRILHRCGNDGRRAVYLVSPGALRRLLLDDDAIVIGDIASRVGILEADARITDARLAHLERCQPSRKQA